MELDETRFQGRKMAQIRCWMCAQSSFVDLVPRDMSSSTLINEPLQQQDVACASARLQPDPSRTMTAELDLPEGKSIAI
jgi:hypothetical protein